MRKEAGFKVIDRIVLDLDGPDRVMEAFERRKDYILQETLTVEVTRTGHPGELKKNWPLGDGEAIISVTRAGTAEQTAR